MMMYQGKRCKHKPRKRPLAILAALLALGLSIGGTIAYLTTQSGGVKNTFTPSEITTTVVEDFDGEVKENIMIKNTGDTTAWIRAAVIVTWQNDKGEVYGKAPVFGTDYTMSSLGTGWTEGDDGFYYYTSPVKSDDEDAKNCTTGVLFETIEVKQACEDIDYFLNVEIIGSGIQYKPAEVFNTHWVSSGLSANTACTTLEKVN